MLYDTYCAAAGHPLGPELVPLILISSIYVRDRILAGFLFRSSYPWKSPLGLAQHYLWRNTRELCLNPL